MAARIEHRNRFRPRTCFNGDGEPKAALRTRGDAMSLMKTIHGPRWRRDGLNVYRCPVCRRWHIGHAPRKRES